MTTSQCATPTLDGRPCTHLVDDQTQACSAGHPNPRYRPAAAAVQHVGGGAAAAVADIDDLATSSSEHPSLEATTHRISELPDGRRREEWLDGDGVLHRTDGGPALIDENGNQGWYLHGELHRTDGPAIIYADGMQAWYQHDRRHRDDGPAVISADGTSQTWYRNGRRCEQGTGLPADAGSGGDSMPENVRALDDADLAKELSFAQSADDPSPEAKRWLNLLVTEHKHRTQ